MAKKRLEDDTSDVLIGIYVTQQQKDAIDQMAKSRKQSTSAYCREGVLIKLYQDELDQPM